MNDVILAATSQVTEADARDARLGPRFGRLDLLSQLAVLAVEALRVNFETMQRDRIGLCLAARAGSLPTDLEYWQGRDAIGGLSPTLFAYTLPSAAMGEIAIRYRLTGPQLCFVGGDADLLPEARDWFERGTIDGCLCVSSDIITAAVAELTDLPPAARVRALFLQRGAHGQRTVGKNDRDMNALFAQTSG